MPELPEVEIVCRALSSQILGKTILDIEVNRYDLRVPVTQNLCDIAVNSSVFQVLRKGKYIVLVLSNQYYLVIHLGMSGNLIYSESYIKQKKHNHVIFHFSNNNLLIFNDPRRFGIVILLTYSQYIEFFKNFGVDALSDEFNTNYLYNTSNKRCTIKSLLMNNKFVTGIGNIYSTESLFLAGIAPNRFVKDLSIIECNNIIDGVKNILLYSIENGGSSIKDYTSPFGIRGTFQNHFLVYNRTRQQCYKCNSSILVIKQNGRSTFFCPYCQL
ncbi:formamidopyrimidine-DNA glycosylase [Ehrlichia chaffeensis str. Liberty]|uniref:Formamidopyrimidine-DNA glycosylase n=1 Tax=Ehrlichia chaffeensis (strain ATCC CRL-10679 / Arkansas) TaxID=205920 RepID=Q2GGM0_EHRCR|nr:bifunctional DNA-formamidopyrimidine glycosylase/DNA-(apurinic or apyrimidinic site) lyase [Ehrlichia chaffeensis]ABD45492.1 formamidopyrimidine-DNA glycosylase [Ehrlichia chaffeensis str. Arkansas]AHX05595.1 formamidopyrimidine-DNA glycosylase [Ehrlichia chaffeensis str. Jax]AHX06585.1 formamidopyrimidine-DNA glycosylase [Ehrlichia chaffeensis str. Liberty]AHX07594.1 formamidopyrimidine-DNA glycosylase [Ehrlichia chaffeensis str. Osceola]